MQVQRGLADTEKNYKSQIQTNKFLKRHWKIFKEEQERFREVNKHFGGHSSPNSILVKDHLLRI